MFPQLRRSYLTGIGVSNKKPVEKFNRLQKLDVGGGRLVVEEQLFVHCNESWGLLPHLCIIMMLCYLC